MKWYLDLEPLKLVSMEYFFSQRCCQRYGQMRLQLLTSARELMMLITKVRICINSRLLAKLRELKWALVFQVHQLDLIRWLNRRFNKLFQRRNQQLKQPKHLQWQNKNWHRKWLKKSSRNLMLTTAAPLTSKRQGEFSWTN